MVIKRKQQTQVACRKKLKGKQKAKCGYKSSNRWRKREKKDTRTQALKVTRYKKNNFYYDSIE